MADRIDAKCECGAALLDAGAPIGTYCERGKECPRFRAVLSGKSDRIDGDLVERLETAADRYAVEDAGWNETKDVFRFIIAEAERRGAAKAFKACEEIAERCAANSPIARSVLNSIRARAPQGADR